MRSILNLTTILAHSCAIFIILCRDFTHVLMFVNPIVVTMLMVLMIRIILISIGCNVGPHKVVLDPPCCILSRFALLPAWFSPPGANLPVVQILDSLSQSNSLPSPFLKIVCKILRHLRMSVLEPAYLNSSSGPVKTNFNLYNISTESFAQMPLRRPTDLTLGLGLKHINTN